jgi:hypothetical protein
MGNQIPVTDRGKEGRVTDYGDRVVAQGDTAARPPAGVVPASSGPGVPTTAPSPGPTAVPGGPQIAKITIYDPKGHLKGSVATAVVQRLDQDLNAIRYPGKPPSFLLNQLNIRFEIVYLSRMSTSNERYTTGRLDFPVYILNGHTNDRVTTKEIENLMLDHGIIYGRSTKIQFEEADDGWKDPNVEGLGIQPLNGYKKVGFIKGDNVAKLAKDVEAGFTNIIKHELGHMFGMVKHSDTGVMRSGIQLAAGSLDYTDANRVFIVNELKRLTKGKSEAEMQKDYERVNF